MGETIALAVNSPPTEKLSGTSAGVERATWQQIVLEIEDSGSGRRAIHGIHWEILREINFWPQPHPRSFSMIRLVESMREAMVTRSKRMVGGRSLQIDRHGETSACEGTSLTSRGTKGALS